MSTNQNRRRYNNATETIIHTNERVVIGQNIALQQDHHSSLRDTEDFAKKRKAVEDYCNRINTIIKWIRENYPEYYEIGVVELTNQDRRDYHKQMHDLRYECLNVKMIKAFISAHKYKPNSDIQYGYVHMRKYHNAIQFGAKRAGVALPQEYCFQMQHFLSSLKREKTNAKKEGKVEEKEADPITFSLYVNICQYAIEVGDLFLWAYTVCQWNCMARSINMDNLSFSQFSLGMDSVIIEYFDNKADQAGEKTVPKNCYANPFNMSICIFTALGCYFSVQEEVWDSGRDTIFRCKGAKPGTAAHNYNSKLKKLFHGMQDVLVEYIRPDHANSHGFRKGSGVYATSGTTCPPPISSVAGRGEWSLGQVLDVYWSFAHAGDEYLGRLLAGLDANSHLFAALPPHFIAGLDNKYVKEGLESCFKNIILNWDASYPNIKGFLLRCLASMVHHADFIQQIIEKNPHNPLAQIPIYSDRSLLEELKKIVTLKPSTKIPKPTGIPPHVSMIVSLRDLIERFTEESVERKKQFDKLGEIVSEKLEQIAADNGTLTRNSVKNILADEFTSFKRTLENEIKNTITSTMEINGFVQMNTNRNSNRSQKVHENSNDEGNFRLYTYANRFFHVPSDFAFPEQVKRERAWSLWLKGMDFKGTEPIRPFRLLQTKMLPTKQLKNQYRNEWMPILQKMENTPGIIIPNIVDDSFVSRSYVIASNYLKEHVCGFIWEKNHETWTIGTWSNKTQRNQIIKYGSEKEKSNLPPPTHHNKPHLQKRIHQRKIRKKNRTLHQNKSIVSRTERRSTISNVAKAALLDNSVNSVDEFETTFSSSPVQLNRNGANIFLSVKCEECSVCNGIMTHHRCMFRMNNGKYFEHDINDRICGKPFCLICANDRGLEEGVWRCADHMN